ncbi:RagB/SusD family nutrient uptake outer membrane protein [Flagellimonas alvinocaridis]|nr:RagB/SusD family nutrient uptake outer membrane protein [Allomuricauda alvinocaridis]
MNQDLKINIMKRISKLIKPNIIQVFSNQKIKIINLLFLVCALIIVSCEDFVDIEPPITGLTSESVFKDDLTATAALSSLYSQMSGGFLGSTINGSTILNGLLTDELIPANGLDQSYLEFYNNNVFPNNTLISGVWGDVYNVIYKSNLIIKNLNEPTSEVSPELKTQLEAEARFIRAYSHLYLSNLFGDIPYITSTDYEINNTPFRISIEDVYANIIEDLLTAKSNLSNDYSFSNEERVRANRWVASALLARTYLFVKDWEKAENESTSIINNSSDFNLVSNLSEVFLKDSKEAIWQWWPGSNGQNSGEGSIFILESAPVNVSLRPDFLNAFEFEDERKNQWVGSYTDGLSNTWYFPFKYKLKDPTPTSQEYSVILRLAEQYLIRAEARAEQGNFTGARNDINMIRSRAGLSMITAGDRISILSAIEQERRVEFFCEYGHRWWDLKRWNRANAVLSPIKIGWEATDILLPIPESEIFINPNIHQNPGVRLQTNLNWPSPKLSHSFNF